MICTLSKHEAEAQVYGLFNVRPQGNIAEATGANVFKNTRRTAYSITDSFLDGITRK